ncbi:MAG: FAD:protein FMN transferase [Actinomycetes bacterium]
MVRHAEHVMGTVFSFDLRDQLDDGVLTDCVDWLHWVDATFSTYRDDSDISRLGRGEARLTECAPEVAQVLDLCAEATRRTDGYFSAMPTGQLDPSGLVKGWAIEEVGNRLVAAGSRCHSVGGGGDVAVMGQPEPGLPWRIGVVAPGDAASIATVVSIRDAGVATSGTAERGAHVVNPLTGRPATELASLTVVGPSLMWADVFATAGLARGMAARGWLDALDGYEAFAIAADGSAWWTQGFAAYGEVPHSGFTGKDQGRLSKLTES